MESLLFAIAVVVGLVSGSFLNVVAYRVPQGMSVVRPPSACPNCSAPIRNRDNVPVFGWLALRGRCRDCGEPISVRYPIVEAVTGVLFGLTALVIGAEWVLPAYLWFVGVTVTLTLTDLDHKRIPNAILYPGTAVGALLLVPGALIDGNAPQLISAFGGAIAYFTVLLLIALVARGGFGFGDVKLAFLLGLFLGYLGWGRVFVGFFLAFLLGGLVSAVLLVAKIKGRKDAIPFGPYLIAGAYLGIVVGGPIVDWYLG